MDDMHTRRQMLTFAAVAGLTPLVDWSAALSSRIDATMLPDLATITTNFVNLRRVVAVPALQPMVLMHLGSLRAKLGESLPAAAGAELQRITAVTAALAGRNAVLMGKLGEARHHYGLAQGLADECGDLETRVLVRWQQIGLYSSARERLAGARTRALDLLNEAELIAGPAAPPRLQVAIRSVRAEQHALMGHAAEAMTDLDVAQRLMALHGPFDDGTLFNPGSEVELAAIRGSALLLAHMPDVAIPALQQAHEGLGVNRTSWAATILADLGTAYAQQDEDEAAVAHFGRALDIAVLDGSTFNLDRVRGAHRRFLGSSRSAAARQFGQRLRALAPTA